MSVQTARGITSDGTTLTLNDVTPSTLYFSDRPERVVGHMTSYLPRSPDRHRETPHW
jgi:hypothetical protein